jgi:hypothetical protein
MVLLVQRNPGDELAGQTVLQWCYSHVTVVLQLCYNGVTIV